MDKNDIIADLNKQGFDCALAIATEAEIQAQAACGMLCFAATDETVEGEKCL